MTRQRLLVVVLLLVALGTIAALVLAPRLGRHAVLSGYIEGEPLYLAAPVAGTVKAMYVVRGQDVAAGAQLFVVDPQQPLSARDQAAAEVAATQAQAIDTRKGQRPLELAVLDANLAAAEARARDAEAALRRVSILADKGYYSKAALDDARVRQAQAGLLGASARLSDVAPTAPSAARVEDVFFQQGEWAPANQPILSLLPDVRIKVRFFVPEAALSAYRVGGVVRFGCDGCAKGLTARIAYISPRPEFTPPVIYSREARDRLVYLVEAQPSMRLNPGQPVDVEPLGEPLK